MNFAGTTFTYVEFQEPTNTFVGVPAAGVPLPTDPESVTWWHAASDLTEKQFTQSVPGVTHLGDFDSARFRAEVQAGWGVSSAGIHEVRLLSELSVMPEAYIENHGQAAMKLFEQKLLNSNFDLAFTWNVKESDFGVWTIIVRRSVLGELPHKPGAKFGLVSSRPKLTSHQRAGGSGPQCEFSTRDELV
jgi:hypothetical protein